MGGIGVFGGSFDPVHNGHLRVAEACFSALNLQKVIFVPAGDQWQKSGATPKQHRLQMLKLATDGDPRFEVSTVDIDREGPTYSYDTLTDLGSIYPDNRLFFILGSDALAGIESWHRASEVLELAQFVVVERPGTAVQVPALAKGRVLELSVDALDLSSTEFRQKHGDALDCSGLVPPLVLSYIEANNLY